MAIKLPSFLSKMVMPRNTDGYPFDLDASERWVRYPTGYAKFWNMPGPYDHVNGVGMLDGFLRQLTPFSWSQRYAYTPFGPDINQAYINMLSQTIVPGFTKQDSFE